LLLGVSTVKSTLSPESQEQPRAQVTAGALGILNSVAKRPVVPVGIWLEEENFMKGVLTEMWAKLWDAKEPGE
jgi:hypothetical protein